MSKEDVHWLASVLGNQVLLLASCVEWRFAAASLITEHSSESEL